MKRIIKRAAAYEDLDSHAAFIGRDRPQAALRFLEAADKTFDALAGLPEIGTLWESDKPHLAGLRFWRIRGFKKYLVFYRILEDRIEVLRVLHAARDLEQILKL